MRIDGSTSVDGRQAVVDGFNRLGQGQVRRRLVLVLGAWRTAGDEQMQNMYIGT